MNMHKTNGLLLTLTPIGDREYRKIVFYKKCSLNIADIEQDVINGIIRTLSDCDLGNNINRIDGKVAGEYVVKQLQQAIEEQVSFDINTLWEIAEHYLSNEKLSGFRDVIVEYIDKNYTICYNTKLDGEKDVHRHANGLILNNKPIGITDRTLMFRRRVNDELIEPLKIVKELQLYLDSRYYKGTIPKITPSHIINVFNLAFIDNVSTSANKIADIVKTYTLTVLPAQLLEEIANFFKYVYLIEWVKPDHENDDEESVTTNNQNNNNEVMKKPDQEGKATRPAKCAMSIDIETVVTLWNAFPGIRPYIKTLVRPLFDLNHPILLSNLIGVICNDYDGVEKHIKSPMTVMIRVVDSIPENHQVLGLDYFQATIYSNDDRPVPMEIWIPVINCTLNTKI